MSTIGQQFCIQALLGEGAHTVLMYSLLLHEHALIWCCERITKIKILAFEIFDIRPPNSIHELYILPPFLPVFIREINLDN